MKVIRKYIWQLKSKLIKRVYRYSREWLRENGYKHPQQELAYDEHAKVMERLREHNQ